MGVYPVMHAGNLFFGKIGFRQIGNPEVSSKHLQCRRLWQSTQCYDLPPCNNENRKHVKLVNTKYMYIASMPSVKQMTRNVYRQVYFAVKEALHRLGEKPDDYGLQSWRSTCRGKCES